MRAIRLLVVASSLILVSAAWADTFENGMKAYNTLDYDTAFAIWQPLAEGGDAESQFSLGMMYGNGFGVMMDDAQAIKWYGLAAEQGHPKALFNLAVMHQNGWGVPPDEEHATTLYRAAADAGEDEAMLALGRHFSMDFSDAYDPVQAYKWYSLAALLNAMDAVGKRDAIASRMSAEQVAEGKALVDAWSKANGGKLAAD